MRLTIRPLQWFMSEVDERFIELERHLAIAQRRKDTVAAEAALASLREHYPDSPTVVLADVDTLVRKGKADEAIELLNLAVERNPDSKELSTRFADLVYEQKIGKITIFTDAPTSAFEEATSARAAAVTSMLVPGLGQIMAGDVPKGWIMLGGYVSGWIFLFSIPNGLEGFMKMLGLSRNPAVQFNGLVMLPLFMVIVFHLWAITDAGASAKQYKRQKVDRPRPPVDKDFEI